MISSEVNQCQMSPGWVPRFRFLEIAEYADLLRLYATVRLPILENASQHHCHRPPSSSSLSRWPPARKAFRLGETLSVGPPARESFRSWTFLLCPAQRGYGETSERL